MIKAYIQQVHPNAGKMVLQALIPFRNLRESVLREFNKQVQNYEMFL